MIKDGFSLDDYGLIDAMIQYTDLETIQQFINIGLHVTNDMLITAASWGNLDLMRLFMKHGATITNDDDCDVLIDSLGECNRSELIEFIGLCHRVAVMRAGTLQTTLGIEHLTEEELIAHATGTH